MGFYNYKVADMKNNRETAWKPEQIIAIQVALVDIFQSSKVRNALNK